MFLFILTNTTFTSDDIPGLIALLICLVFIGLFVRFLVKSPDKPKKSKPKKDNSTKPARKDNMFTDEEIDDYLQKNVKTNLCMVFPRKNILIGGISYSNKNTIIDNFVLDNLIAVQFQQYIFIDLKKSRLIDYKNIDQTLFYCDEIEIVPDLLKWVLDFIDYRYSVIKKEKWENWRLEPLYLIIDEYADLLALGNKELEKYMSKILILGRNAGVYLLIATQYPTNDVITLSIRANTELKVALKTNTLEQSNNIIGTGKAAYLPDDSYLLYDDELMRFSMSPIDEELRKKIIQYYQSE